MISEINELILEANSYTEDNVYQDVFYHSNLVDIDQTADAEPGIVVLNGGTIIYWNEEAKVFEVS